MKLSLRHKALLMILLFAVALSGITVYVSSWVVTGIIKSNYEEKATDLSKTVALSLDAGDAAVLRDEILEKYRETGKALSGKENDEDALAQYMANFASLDAATEYVSLERSLQSYQSLNGAEAVYLCCLDSDTDMGICMVDAGKESPLSAGYPEKLSPEAKQALKNPREGIPAHINNSTTRGELVTAGAPLYDDRNQVICFAMVDLSTRDMHTQQFQLVALLLTLIFGLTVIICFAAVMFINRRVINPINQLSEAAQRYCQEDDQRNHQQFARLDIRTSDEIESLANSMKQMERDINDSIAHLLSTTKELTSTIKEKEELDTIAKKDSLTGVRNKYSYEEEKARLQEALDAGETEFGIVVLDLNDLKHFNDDFGHDKGDLAIVQLCNIICTVFSHSPVFRIGGDEFVVVLRGSDFYNVRQLVLTFNNAMLGHNSDADLAPWEHITAALGYAIYDPEKDDGIDSVFKRADHAMYEQKKTMKSRRG